MITQTIAGYRLVRTVAESSRACTLLAQPVSQAAAPSEPVVLTLYRSNVSSASVYAECDATTRMSSEHLTAVWDIASASDGSTVVVSEWIPGISLSKLLRTRSYLTAGEAITILVPLVETIGKLHQRGVVHEAFGLESVVFRASGSPVIIGLSNVMRTEPTRTPAVLSNDAAVRLDIAALVRVATVVLSAVRTDDSDTSRLRECQSWLQSSDLPSEPTWASQLEHHLFSLGAPEPVRLVEHSTTVIAGEHQRSQVFSGGEGGFVEPPDGVRNRSSIFGLPASLHNEFESTVLRARAHLQSAHGGIRRWLAPVRLRVWILGALAAVAVITATIAVVVAPTESENLSPSPSPSTSPQSNHSEPIQTTTDLIPSLAVRELLFARELCFRDLSVECLRDVENADSPAFVADANEIRRVIDGGELRVAMLFGADDVIGSQELGDSVLFSFGAEDNNKPASILLVKGEAGWRIRSYTLSE